MIDEYPILCIAAAMATGPSLMENIGELRHKEADRIAIMAKGLRLAGVTVDETETSMRVYGTKTAKGDSYIKGGFNISSEHDHRIAMSFLTLGFVSSDRIIVDGVSTIETSFPGFVELMNKHGARISPINSA
jgi:3-phosphoshikimate 1-carboxyvinyltransferase